MKRPIRTAALVLAATALTGAPFAYQALAQEQRGLTEAQLVIAPPAGAPMSFADLIESVSPAVVSVNTTATIEAPTLPDGMTNPFEGTPFEDFFGDAFPRMPEDYESRGVGSGFFISADGHIVTNNHVVDDADEIMVRLNDERELTATLIGTDAATDLALLKVESDNGKPFPYVKFDRDPAARVGDWVVAVGSPFGFGNTATAGIISADGRQIGAGPYTDFLQVDAPINRGNSGGPLFDLAGNVIGVNTAIFSPSGGNVGIGFAIPSELASKVVDQLMTAGKVSRGWLGVSIQAVSDDLAEALGIDEAKGALVSRVFEGSPALKSGVKVGDLVLKLDGVEVKDNLHLTRMVGDLKAGQTARFEVLRDGKIRNVSVKIGERPSEDALAQGLAGPDAGEDEGEEMLGLSVGVLEDDAREAFDLEPGEGGVLIQRVARGSEAAKKGLTAGEAIVKVGGQKVGSPEEFADAVEKARKDDRESVLLFVKTAQGFGRFVAIPLQGDEG